MKPTRSFFQRPNMPSWALVVSVLSVALAACGPIIGIPGGRLSGAVAPPPSDWSFSDAVETFQLETRPDDPYSVNIWGVAVGEHFYIGTSPDTAWSQHIADDPRVRLRLGETLYELRAERAGEDADREAYWASVKRKYDYEPDPEQMEGGLFFRLFPR